MLCGARPSSPARRYADASYQREGQSEPGHRCLPYGESVRASGPEPPHLLPTPGSNDNGIGGRRPFEASCFRKIAQALVLKFPDPTPFPGEVVLEIKASGMCGIDLKFFARPGTRPPPLGLAHCSRSRGPESSGSSLRLGSWVARRGRVCQRVSEPTTTRVCGRCKHGRVGWFAARPRHHVGRVTVDGSQRALH